MRLAAQKAAATAEAAFGNPCASLDSRPLSIEKQEGLGSRLNLVQTDLNILMAALCLTNAPYIAYSACDWFCWRGVLKTIHNNLL